MAEVRPVIAVFCMPENGHFQRMCPLIAMLSECGAAVHVFTHGKFRDKVLANGGRFFDMFSKYPIEAVDDESRPVPSRFVSYAAAYAEPLVEELESIGASLVIHDGFAVIGRLVATLIGLPRVNVYAGHNPDPSAFIEGLRNDPRVSTSQRCHDAVKVLRERFGMADASPFSYVSSRSNEFNLYCEPPEFLDEHERRALEPVSFFGSLADVAGRKAGGTHFDGAGADTTRIYASFGTVIWRYYAGQALEALKTLASAFEKRDDVRAIISLGGADRNEGVKELLTRSNVAVEDYVDQDSVLAEADIFVTHHGLNSTHEAIGHGTFMLSYPFFWDQPGLARKCQSLGVALPLSRDLRGPFDENDVLAALSAWRSDGERIRQALSRAQEWERSVIAGRAAVVDRILELAQKN
jgi:UDP:flavonoid glycosyltransferase YjiC (YdhE family)